MLLDLDLVALLLGVGSLPFLWFLFRREAVPNTTLLYAGFCAVMSAQAFSLAGAAMPHPAFTTLDHAFLALGGVLFALGCRRLGRGERR